MSSPHASRVAVIDPDCAVRDSLVVLLTAAGIVAQGFDSVEAFLAGTDPNLVGCVTGNIGRDGGPARQLFAAARSRGHDIPVILFSANMRPSVIRQAMNAGVAAVLARPANPGEFIAEVRRLLGI
jgi:FixJ family two-component response regulator